MYCVNSDVSVAGAAVDLQVVQAPPALVTFKEIQDSSVSQSVNT